MNMEDLTYRPARGHFQAMSLYILKSLQAALSQRFSNLCFIGWIYVLVSSEKQKTSKPVKLEVYAIQTYMYCYGGYFAHK